MRQGELLGIKWQDINFSTGTLQVRRILTRVSSETSVIVFIEVEPKTQQSRCSMLKMANLSDIRFHDLRHSAATLLLSPGIHPKAVQEMLGHTQISMTREVL
jgi:integrase